MDNLSAVMQAGHSYEPYPKAVRVCIAEIKYDGDTIILRLADKSEGVKAVCYEKKLKEKLQINKTVLLRKFQKGRTCIIINRNTQVSPAAALEDIKPEYIKKAKELVNPPSPQHIPLRNIKLPTPGTTPSLITVSGEVVQVSLQFNLNAAVHTFFYKHQSNMQFSHLNLKLKSYTRRQSDSVKATLAVLANKCFNSLVI